MPGVLAGVLVGMLALGAGCSGGTDSASVDVSEAGGADAGIVERGLADGDVAAADRTGGTGGTAGSSSGAANRPVVQTRAVIRRGEVALVAREVNRARTEIDDLLASLGGYLASEDTFNDRSGRPERSVLVMRVPEPAFDEAMRVLAGIGRTERRSKDVTTEVIDVDTRVATQEASLTRLQRFLRQASDVDDMIRLESEIATRQATLESLMAQQKYLTDQTSMSTITVRLRTPASPPPQEPAQEAGFAVGLANGWAALKAVLVAGATVAGALLPFLVALPLLGVPVWLLVRAVAHRRGPSEPVPPPAPDAS